MGPTGIPMHPSGWDSLDAYIPLATDKVPVDPEKPNHNSLAASNNLGRANLSLRRVKPGLGPTEFGAAPTAPGLM